MSSFQTSSSSSDAPSPADPYEPLHDVNCTVDVVLGTGRLKVRDCLALSPHAVLPLWQSAGSDLEVRVHGIGIASGEVVILEDKTALRISRITPSPSGSAS